MAGSRREGFSWSRTAFHAAAARHGPNTVGATAGESPDLLSCDTQQELVSHCAHLKLHPELGAGIEWRFVENYGYIVETVAASPGQPELTAGDIVVAVAGQSLALTSEDDADEIVASNLMDGVELCVLREVRDQVSKPAKTSEQACLSPEASMNRDTVVVEASKAFADRDARFEDDMLFSLGCDSLSHIVDRGKDCLSSHTSREYKDDPLTDSIAEGSNLNGSTAAAGGEAPIAYTGSDTFTKPFGTKHSFTEEIFPNEGTSPPLPETPPEPREHAPTRRSDSNDSDSDQEEVVIMQKYVQDEVTIAHGENIDEAFDKSRARKEEFESVTTLEDSRKSDIATGADPLTLIQERQCTIDEDESETAWRFDVSQLLRAEARDECKDPQRVDEHNKLTSLSDDIDRSDSPPSPAELSRIHLASLFSNLDSVSVRNVDDLLFGGQAKVSLVPVPHPLLAPATKHKEAEGHQTVSKSIDSAACTLPEARGAGCGRCKVKALSSWLDDMSLQEYLDVATTWCVQMGAVSLEEIADNIDDFSEGINLKPIERQRVRKWARSMRGDIQHPTRPQAAQKTAQPTRSDWVKRDTDQPPRKTSVDETANRSVEADKSKGVTVYTARSERLAMDSVGNTGLDLRWNWEWGIFVRSVDPLPGQPGLKAGDYIVAIDGCSLRRRAHEECETIFAERLQNGVVLNVISPSVSEAGAVARLDCPPPEDVLGDCSRETCGPRGRGLPARPIARVGRGWGGGGRRGGHDPDKMWARFRRPPY